MRRLNADPEFAAANSARMQQRNADPDFRAKQRASRAIPDGRRAAIIDALRADPNPRRAAKKVAGVSYSTVLRIAKASGIALERAPSARPRRKSVADFQFVNVHVGAQLRKRRRELRISYRRLGQATGVSFKQIWKYERAKTQISLARLCQLAWLLNVPVAYFFEGLPPTARPLRQ